MNVDLERLEALYHDIIATRAGESDVSMWDCLERSAQEMLVLRLPVETEQWRRDEIQSGR